MSEKYSKDVLEKVKELYIGGIVQFDIAKQLGLNKNQVKRMLQQVLSKAERDSIVENRKRFENSFYINKKYGRLLIQKYFYKSKIGVCFECLCDCGNIIVKPKHYIITGNTQSCGCLYDDRRTNFGEISGKYWGRLRLSAAERNISFDLDIRDAWAIFVQQNRICAITGAFLCFVKNYSKDYRDQTASLDRIDNSLGYTRNNVQWVHKKSNTFRGGLELNQLFSLAKEITNHQRLLALSDTSNRWDMKYISLAEFISQWSKDNSTKVGAVIFDKDFRVVSMGYNGLPQQIYDREEWLNDRELKLKTIIHAEMNAILFAKQSLENCSIATWPFMPCSNCASSIAQVGIKRVVSFHNDNPRWKDNFELSKSIFQDKGIILKLYENKLFGWQ